MRRFPSFAPLVLVLGLVAALTACAPRGARQDAPRPTTPTVPTVIRVGSGGQVTAVRLEEYVVATALAEIGPAGETPATTAAAFRVQSIITRTYAASHMGRHASEGYDLCDATHCQVYDPKRLQTSRFAAVARQAAEDTAGQVLVFNQRLTEALFHADCGGHTAAADIIWGGRPVPYLVGTPDPAAGDTHRRWQYRMTREQLMAALNANPLSAIAGQDVSVRVAERDVSGRAAIVEIASAGAVRRLRGEQLRAILSQAFGYRSILSSRFEITPTADGFQFDGTGFGHGVGLCQVGATARLRRGDSVEAVLSAYYPGARVIRAGRPRPLAFPGT